MKKIGILVFWWTKGEGEPKNYSIYKYDPSYDKIIGEIIDACLTRRNKYSQPEYHRVINVSSYDDIVASLNSVSNYAVSEYNLESFFEGIDPNSKDKYNYINMLERDDELSVLTLDETKLRAWRVKPDKEILEEINELILTLKLRKSLDSVKQIVDEQISYHEQNEFKESFISSMNEFVDENRIQNKKVREILDSFKVNDIQFERTDYVVKAEWDFTLLEDINIKVTQSGEYSSPNTYIRVKSRSINIQMYDNDSYSLDEESVEEFKKIVCSKLKPGKAESIVLSKVIKHLLETLVGQCTYF
ncbi:hypothetical protein YASMINEVIRUS_391 [Yasminevirus sp. GU-2018]|uniref:Uncharacterized protein n=1 Tax=Yasminevirus sp. GU-2018 TaxID=2420051 RepID=A0A5K0U7J6_9VIRU|nr:hypothetical protein YASMINEVIRUS_391 [Yasminevirus sp. GU-2018]